MPDVLRPAEDQDGGTDSPERRAFGEAFPSGQAFLPQRRQSLQVIERGALTGTSAGQRGQQTPGSAGYRPRLPDQKAPIAAHALPTGRGSSGFRNVLYPRANAHTECWSGQPCPAGPRRVTRRRASAPGSAHHNRGKGNQCALLGSGTASRLPATQSLTARTSVAVCEP